MQAVKDQGPAGIWPINTSGRQDRTQAADGRGLAPADGGRKVDSRVQRGEIIRGENTLSGTPATGGGLTERAARQGLAGGASVRLWR